MLGFAPLAANALASVGFGLVSILSPMSATGGIVFGGSSNIGAVAMMSATGGLTFGGTGFVTTRVYRSATGGITFGGSPLLRVAGKPMVFVAVPQRFEFRPDGADYTFIATSEQFTFRGWR